MSPEKTIGYARDAGCVVVGLGGIVWQIYTGQMSAVGMGTCMALLSITGAINVKQVLPSKSGGRGRSSPARPSGSHSPSSRSGGGER